MLQGAVLKINSGIRWCVYEWVCRCLFEAHYVVLVALFFAVKFPRTAHTHNQWLGRFLPHHVKRSFDFPSMFCLTHCITTWPKNHHVPSLCTLYRIVFLFLFLAPKLMNSYDVCLHPSKPPFHMCTLRVSVRRCALFLSEIRPSPLYFCVRMWTMSGACVHVALTRHCVVFAVINWITVCVCAREQIVLDPFVKILMCASARVSACVCIYIYICWRSAEWMCVRWWVYIALLTACDGGGGRQRMKDVRGCHKIPEGTAEKPASWAEEHYSLTYPDCHRPK